MTRRRTILICDINKLLTLRKNAALNQEALAGAAKLSVRTIQRAEKGDPIDLQSVREIANALNVEPKDLVKSGENQLITNSDAVATEELMLKNDPSGRHFFAKRFGRAFPGVREVVWYEDQEEIEERLERLLLSIPTTPHSALWWLRGSSNMYIHEFRKLGSGVFVLNEMELRIAKIAVVYSNSDRRKFVYMDCEGLPPTGVYDWYDELMPRILERGGYCCEEYGEFDGKKVTRQEYDDGAAIVDGKLIDLPVNTNLRARYLTPYNFIIGPNGSVANNVMNDAEIEQILDNMLRGDRNLDDLIRAMEKLPCQDRT